MRATDPRSPDPGRLQPDELEGAGGRPHDRGRLRVGVGAVDDGRGATGIETARPPDRPVTSGVLSIKQTRLRPNAESCAWSVDVLDLQTDEPEPSQLDLIVASRSFRNDVDANSSLRASAGAAVLNPPRTPAATNLLTAIVLTGSEK